MAESSSKTPEEASQSFNKRFTDIVMSAYTTLSVSYGLDLGLFDVMARADDMQTAAEIAELASCKERYVKEWLAHMVVSDIVNVNETGSKYLLPVHHREALASKGNFMRTFARMLPYVAIPHEDLVNCARANGSRGVPFSRVARAFEELRKDTGDAKTGPLLDVVISNMSGVEEQLMSGISVCDVGCGMGHSALEMARRYPNSEITGFDVYEPFIRVAKQSAATSGLQNIQFLTMDAAKMTADWTNTFELIHLRSVLHDIPLASKALAECYRCLTPGGHFTMQEMNIQSNIHEALKVPEEKTAGQIYLPLSLYHCLPSSMYVEGSQALGGCVGKERLVELLNTAGFRDIAVSVIPGTSSVQIYSVKPNKE